MMLHAIRRYRRQVEDILRAELSVLEGIVEVSVARARALQKNAEQASDGFDRALREGLSPADTMDRSNALDYLRARVRDAVTSLGHARERWEQKRSEVVEAARERKTIELLEARRLQARVVRLRRLEQQAIDEAAQSRFLRSVREQAIL